jgi:hypothetical protein
MRTDALEALSVTNPRLYEEKMRLAVEVARFLRQNVVQGEKVQGQSEGADTEMWSKPLRVHEYYSELTRQNRTSCDTGH